jgi:hypothetical protein
MIQPPGISTFLVHPKSIRDSFLCQLSPYMLYPLPAIVALHGGDGLVVWFKLVDRSLTLRAP